MLKVGGQWVSPVEVETALLAHAAVQECAVVGRTRTPTTLVKPMAFVVLRAGTAGTPALAAALQQFVRRASRTTSGRAGSSFARHCRDGDREASAVQAPGRRLQRSLVRPQRADHVHP